MELIFPWQAMRDLENDNLPEYTEADLIEKWQ